MTVTSSTRIRRLCAGAALFGLGLAAHAESLVGLTTTNALVRFDSASPLNGSAPVFITGLFANEQILGIDLRPATGALFGLGSSGSLYTLNASTGAATFVSSLSGASLMGSSFGVDFNPTVDRLRVTSNTGQNLRINVDTGAVTVDGMLNGAATGIAAAAYTNSFAGAATTTLYGIGSASNTLYVQAPPNNGTLAAVGALGVDTSAASGFDISGTTGVAYASLTDNNTSKSSVYTVNLATGSATLLGAFGYGGNTAVAAPLLDIAVVTTPVPEPGTYAMMVLGLLCVGTVMRRRAGAKAA